MTPANAGDRIIHALDQAAEHVLHRGLDLLLPKRLRQLDDGRGQSLRAPRSWSVTPTSSIRELFKTAMAPSI